MRANKVERLLEQIPEINRLGDKLLIDVKLVFSHVGKKRASSSVQQLRFTLLNTTMSDNVQLEVPLAVKATLDVPHLTDAYDNNEIQVAVLGVDDPFVDELDVRIGATIGFALGYSPEDVLLRVEDGAGRKNTTDKKNGVVGTVELIEVGDLYERLLADDDRESVPSPILAAIA